jgi:hypothetical protein
MRGLDTGAAYAGFDSYVPSWVSGARTCGVAGTAGN